MRNMSGEELNRKYHELCGWCQANNSEASRFHSLTCQRGETNCGGIIPPLHLDANLAIAELEKLGGHISISTVEDDAECSIKGRHWNVLTETKAEFENWPDVCGTTFCEAILKALIDAKQKQEVG